MQVAERSNLWEGVSDNLKMTEKEMSPEFFMMMVREKDAIVVDTKCA